MLRELPTKIAGIQCWKPAQDTEDISDAFGSKFCGRREARFIHFSTATATGRDAEPQPFLFPCRQPAINGTQQRDRAIFVRSQTLHWIAQLSERSTSRPPGTLPRRAERA